MSTQPPYEDLLKDLKSKLDKGEMSTLVGAGFSKNLDSSFPDWFELINEMVLITEGTRLEKEFSDRFPKVSLKSKKYKKFLGDEIWNHITGIGPLVAVSNYIKLKGFRESVDHMVDQNTPYIEVQKGQRYLRRLEKGKITLRPLKKADVASHQKLVDLPWNNIFTTNYDNLLEKCIDVNKKEDVENMMDDLQLTVDRDTSEIEELATDLASKNLRSEQLRGDLELKKAKFESTEDIQALEVIIQKLNADISNLKGEISFKKLVLKASQSRLESLNDIKRNFRTIVINSSDLAIRKNQNIIKIHGSICTEDPKTYGFDGDSAKHYVIAQEDYDSYPKKHEAFTQLMRISLLQESFCLFGFSGIDPNFLGWIGWVRDVIQKSPGKTAGAVKIYMIDVWDKQPAPDKSLFYKNHQIAFIPLQDPECLSFLENQTGKPVAGDNPTARINLLLDYLSMDKLPSENKVAYEVIKQSEYQSLWDKIPYFEVAGERVDFFIRRADDLTRLKYYKRIATLLGNTDTSQHYFLKGFQKTYKMIKSDETAVSDLLKITLLMLQEVFLPSSVIFQDDKKTFPLILKVAKKIDGLQNKFKIIEFKDAVWSNEHDKIKKLHTQLKSSKDEEIIQELQYQTALYEFYNFRFKKVAQVLGNWRAIGHWSMKKAGLQSRLSLGNAIKELRASEQETVQEDIYKHHILSYLYAANGQRDEGQRQYQIVKAVEKSNIKSFSHQITRMLSSFKVKPEKLLPYGNKTFTISNTEIFGTNPIIRNAIQLLSIWLETGYPLHLPRLTNLNTDQVYLPLKKVLGMFPEPALFFALQYENPDFIIRFSQDFAYIQSVEKIRTTATRMMETFFDEDTPLKFKRNLLLVLSEFIGVMPSADWQDFYLAVWKSEIERDLLLLDFRIQKQEFLMKGISFLTDPAIAKILIEELLEAFIKNKELDVRNNVIQFLYQFRNNTYLDNLVQTSGLKIKPKLFDELTYQLKRDVFFLFVLGNISFSFTQAQFDRVKQTLSEIGAFEDTNSRLWRVILFFGDGDPRIEQRVKDGILKSGSLWDSGIDLKTSTYTARASHISLSTLKNYKKGKSLRWSDAENQQIYNALVIELDKINHWINHLERSRDFVDIIKEMKYFLETEEPTLISLDRFLEIKNTVSRLYDSERVSEQNIDAILGDDKSAIILQIEKISNEVFKNNLILENDFQISGLLYKLLLKKEPALAASLAAIASWFYLKWENIAIRRYQEQLELIFRSYRNGAEIDADEPFFEEQMIKIAIVLKKWDSKEDLIDETIDLLRTSRFNHIKFNLRSEISADSMI
ncbi:hypothetical protein D3C87_589550 [compost metagenome]